MFAITHLADCHWSIKVSLLLWFAAAPSHHWTPNIVNLILTALSQHTCLHAIFFSAFCHDQEKDSNLLFWFSISLLGSSFFTCIQIDFHAYLLMYTAFSCVVVYAYMRVCECVREAVNKSVITHSVPTQALLSLEFIVSVAALQIHIHTQAHTGTLTPISPFVISTRINRHPFTSHTAYASAHWLAISILFESFGRDCFCL